MSNGLEALEELKNDINNRALLFSDEKIIIIEKELKALEIIKDKIDWNMSLNHFINIGYISLEEYNLLREVLL